MPFFPGAGAVRIFQAGKNFIVKPVALLQMKIP
jgi:hypothetical protein